MPKPPSKYGRILSEFREFPEDEPMFLIRAQDKFAPHVVELYATLAEIQGLNTVARQVRGVAAEIIAWQADNPDKVKEPD